MEHGRRLGAVKDIIFGFTPQRIAEKKISKSIDNFAAAAVLDTIEKTRQFYMENGLRMDLDTRLHLSHNQQEALQVLAGNGVIDFDDVERIYSPMLGLGKK